MTEQTKVQEPAALPQDQPKASPPPPPTHAALPVEAFNEMARRISRLPWETVDSVMEIIKNQTIYISIEKNNNS